MSYITLDELKIHLDISGNDQDVLLTRSITLADALIDGYLGAELSDPTKDQVFTTVIGENRNSLKLPMFPILEVESVALNGDAIPSTTGWWVDSTHGFIEDLPLGGFRGYAGRSGTRASVIFRAGWLQVPKAIRGVALALASGIFANGGEIAGGAGGTGDLKSLTMFDAMSMSFDVGTNAAEGNTPAGMVGAWSFALDRFRVTGPGLA